MVSLFEEMGGTYTLRADDMYIPTYPSLKGKRTDMANTAEYAIHTSGSMQKLME